MDGIKLQITGQSNGLYTKNVVAADEELIISSSDLCSIRTLTYKTDGTLFMQELGTEASLCVSTESSPFSSNDDVNGKKLKLKAGTYVV